MFPEGRGFTKYVNNFLKTSQILLSIIFCVYVCILIFLLPNYKDNGDEFPPPINFKVFVFCHRSEHFISLKIVWYKMLICLL